MKKKKISKLWISLVGLLLLFGCATTSGTKEVSSSEALPVITDIAVEDGAVVIKSNMNFTYTIYSANDPFKTTVEIPDMSIGPFTNKIVSNTPGIAEIIPQQMDSPNRSARIDIIMQTPSIISPSYNNNALTLSIAKEQQVALSEIKDAGSKEIVDPPVAEPVLSVEPPANAVKAVEENKQPLSKATEIRGIELSKTGGAVKVLITGNGAIIPNVFPINERIVVDIPNVILKASLPEHVIAPLKNIRAGKHKDKLRIVIDLQEKTNYDVAATGNSVEISLLANEMQATHDKGPKAVQAYSNRSATAVDPPKLSQPAAGPEKLVEGEFRGKKISLDFQDADIIPIFRLLGDISGYNIVVNPAVKGNITLKLINVPWDQALDIMLKTFSLSKIVDGNIIRIVPTAVVSKELDEITKAKKSRDEAGDLSTRIFPVNFADLAKLKDMIDKAKVVSSRGSITLDERGSAIVVNDLDRNLEQIGALIKQLDQESMQARQVMIDAKIVEITSTYTKDLGIQWGAFLAGSGDNGTGVIGANGMGSTLTPVSPLVNLPASQALGQIGFGFINRAGTFALDLKLSAMEQLNKGKIISNPKIMTMNNQEAKITQGSTIYLASTASGANTASFTAVDATLSLTVKPRVAPGGAIFMDIEVTKDQPGPIDAAGNTTILKNTAKTSVMINNGDTVVIGGIFKKSETSNDNAIPYLSKLPLLGKLLFNQERVVDDTSEILIFISPRILEFSSLR
jgi:type IV pilus secretin PilQ/predicted competence protein